eukprot:9048508-Prorocentrum_lima.AAC.1
MKAKWSQLGPSSPNLEPLAVQYGTIINTVTSSPVHIPNAEKIALFLPAHTLESGGVYALVLTISAFLKE